jgi:hypothetical protein
MRPPHAGSISPGISAKFLLVCISPKQQILRKLCGRLRCLFRITSNASLMTSYFKIEFPESTFSNFHLIAFGELHISNYDVISPTCFYVLNENLHMRHMYTIIYMYNLYNAPDSLNQSKQV